jgi:hypothetical protein
LGSFAWLINVPRDREAQPGPRTHLVALLCAVELVEDALQIRPGDAVALVQYLQLHATPFLPTLDADDRAGWCATDSIGAPWPDAIAPKSCKGRATYNLLGLLSLVEASSP